MLPLTKNPITVRATLIGIALIPLNSYWVLPSLTLLFNVLFTLLVLITLDKLLHVLRPILAFTQSELLTICTMSCQVSVFAVVGNIALIFPSGAAIIKHNGYTKLFTQCEYWRDSDAKPCDDSIWNIRVWQRICRFRRLEPDSGQLSLKVLQANRGPATQCNASWKRLPVCSTRLDCKTSV